MYRLLIAIDGSQHSLNAAGYAAVRAKATPCKIDLLHVEKPVMAWEVGPVSSTEAVSETRGVESEELLRLAAARFEGIAAVEMHTATGEPAAIILEEAQRLAADEIILGSRGLRPLNAAMLGSVAYKVLHDAKVPVVVVR